jgi:hypothetical protein
MPFNQQRLLSTSSPQAPLARLPLLLLLPLLARAAAAPARLALSVVTRALRRCGVSGRRCWRLLPAARTRSSSRRCWRGEWLNCVCAGGVAALEEAAGVLARVWAANEQFLRVPQLAAASTLLPASLLLT